MFVNLDEKLKLSDSIIIHYGDKLETQFIAKQFYISVELYIETAMGEPIYKSNIPSKVENRLWWFEIDTTRLKPEQDYRGIFTGITELGEREKILEFFITCTKGAI